jgi:vacuolar-type H+-ATPase catalytic subunit A/Vma1
MSRATKINQGDWWLFGYEISQLIEAIRKDEREKAAQIVEQWPVDAHHIVQKERLKERRAAIASAIRGVK